MLLRRAHSAQTARDVYKRQEVRCVVQGFLLLKMSGRFEIGIVFDIDRLFDVKVFDMVAICTVSYTHLSEVGLLKAI